MEATNETGKNPAGAQSRAGEAGANLSVGLGVQMTRAQYDQLSSNGKHACPDCGLKTTTPCGGCNCPPNESGYGTRHINKYHHKCSTPNVPHEGRTAALSPGVPLDAVVGSQRVED